MSNPIIENMQGGLLPIDRDQLRDYLLAKEVPVFEAELLKFAADISSLPDTTEELFRVHFSLFHELYAIKFDNASKGYYLHIDPMRIRMLHVPESGMCRHYFPEEGKYCGEFSGNGNYCPHHECLYADNISRPLFDPLYDFYMNPENIVFGTSSLLQKLMNGVIVYAFRRGEIQRSLEFFDLVRPTSDRVRKRYHELARKYHPDRHHGNEELMKELNRSYQVLREVFVV
jgi:hypothetical protein